MTTITSGRNVASVVKITSATAVSLVLAGTAQSLTSTVTAEVTDNFGSVQTGVPLTFTSSDPSVADVDLETGVVTAVAPGQTIIEVSAPFGNNTVSTVNADGTPLNKIYANVTLQVTEYGNGHAIVPDFSFTLNASSYTVGPTGSATVTVTQTVSHGLTSPVTYRISGPYANGGLSQAGTILWSPTALQITGNGTGTITITATGAPAGSVPFFVWGQANPQAVSSGDLYGDSVRALTHTTAATLVVS